MDTNLDSQNPLAILERAAELRRAGAPFALATVTVSQRPTSARAGAKAIVTAEGALFGWVGGACAQPSVVRHALEALRDGVARVVRLSPEPGAPRAGVIELPMTCHSGGTLEVFVEPFLPEPQLVVVGDTPVAHALLAFGRQLGYYTVALGNPHSAADVARTTLDFDALSAVRATFVVIASMGDVDEEALLAACRRGADYIALVGSRRRFDALADYLRACGVDAAVIAGIRAPAGLDIQAETAAEIALSVLAEMTQVRRAARRAPALNVTTALVFDPICGMTVDLATAKHTLELDGETYDFCCPACKREFEQLRVAS